MAGYLATFYTAVTAESVVVAGGVTVAAAIVVAVVAALVHSIES